MSDIDYGSGGGVEAFDDQGDLDARAQYLEGFAESPMLGFYQYQAGNAILRLGRDLTPEQASEYGSSFRALFEE